MVVLFARASSGESVRLTRCTGVFVALLFGAMHVNRSSSHARLTAPHEALCAALGVTLPPLGILPGPDVPQPYRDLLVHDNDMTPTLEAFHACNLSLHVMRKQCEDDTLMRQVLLMSDRTNKPVAIGVIRIFLDSFDDATRDLILACRKPLGGILASQRIAHFSQPRQFFAAPPDPMFTSALQLDAPPPTLYGRYNELFHEPKSRLAQVIEILAPVAGEQT